MTDAEDRAYRQQCRCDDCKKTRKALELLDDIATSEFCMAMEDIDDLCGARELLAAVLGLSYNEDTNRYEAPTHDNRPSEPATD